MSEQFVEEYVWRGDSTSAVAAAKNFSQGLSKVSTAMLLLQNSSAQMGGEIGKAVSKVTALASLLSVGGPIGIALAATTAAIAAGTWAWNKYSEAANEAAEDLKRNSDAMAAVTARVGTRIAQIKRQIAEMEGGGARKFEIGLHERGAEAAEARAEAIRARLADTRSFMTEGAGGEMVMAPGAEKRIAELQQALAWEEKAIKLNKEQAESLRELTRTEVIHSETSQEKSTIAIDMLEKIHRAAENRRREEADRIKIAEHNAQEETDIKIKAANLLQDHLLHLAEQRAEIEDRQMTERERREVELKERIASLASETISIVGQATGDLIFNWARTGQAGGKQFAVGIIKGIGQTLFAKGIADAAMAVANFFNPVVGGPVTAIPLKTAAAAEISLGAAMMAGAGFASRGMGGGSGGGGGGSGGSFGGGGIRAGGFGGGINRGSGGGGNAEGGDRVISIVVDGFLSPSEMGRHVQKGLDAAHFKGLL